MRQFAFLLLIYCFGVNKSADCKSAPAYVEHFLLVLWNCAFWMNVNYCTDVLSECNQPRWQWHPVLNPARFKIDITDSRNSFKQKFRRLLTYFLAQHPGFLVLSQDFISAGVHFFSVFAFFFTAGFCWALAFIENRKAASVIIEITFFMCFIY